MDLAHNKWLGFRPWNRHSLVLLVAGMTYVFIGLAYASRTPEPAREIALSVATVFLPLRVWGLVFIAVGLLTILSARWPPVAETWGYMVLTGHSSAWAGFYLMSMLVADSPINNLSAFAIWALVAFMWWAISGLVNPDKTVVLLVPHG